MISISLLFVCIHTLNCFEYIEENEEDVFVENWLSFHLGVDQSKQSQRNIFDQILYLNLYRNRQTNRDTEEEEHLIHYNLHRVNEWVRECGDNAKEKSRISLLGRKPISIACNLLPLNWIGQGRNYLHIYIHWSWVGFEIRTHTMYVHTYIVALQLKSSCSHWRWFFWHVFRWLAMKSRKNSENVKKQEVVQPSFILSITFWPKRMT